MAKLTMEQLRQILTDKLDLCDAEFRLEKVDGRIVGHVISPTFRGMRDDKRQMLIWDALDAELGADSVRVVGMILPYTPEEWNLGGEDQTATKGARRAG